MPVPSAPTGLTATAGDAQVALAWSATATATSYNVYRGTTPAGEALLASGVAVTTYTDTGRTNGKTYYYTVSAVNGSGEGSQSSEVAQYARAKPTAYTFVAGRQWIADPANPTATDAIFDRSAGVAYSTNGGVPVFEPAIADESLYTKATDIQNADVLVKYKMTGAGQRGPHLVFRRIDNSNIWELQLDFNDKIQPVSRSAGSSAFGAITAAIAPDDVTSWRWSRFQCIDGVGRYRNWFDGDPEPTTWDAAASGGTDWFFPGPFSPVPVMSGMAGIRFYFNVAVTAYVVVTELIRSDTNLLSNADLSILNRSDGLPTYWSQENPGTGASWSVEAVTGYDGKSRQALRLDHASNNGQGQFWANVFYNSLQTAGPSYGFTNPNPQPDSAWTQRMTVRVWSRGDTVVNTNPDPAAIGATADHYYSNFDGTNDLTGRPDYYRALGPNVTGIGNQGGTGTWGWYLTEWQMEWGGWPKPFQAISQYGTHDATTTGTLWFLDPEFIPLNPPTALGATGRSGGVDLAWTVPTTEWGTFNVYRDGVLLASGVATNSYSDTTATPGVSYAYTVTTQYGAGESIASSSANGTASGGGLLLKRRKGALA